TAGIPGHTYRFYSVATDNVGNVEPTPAAAEATTLFQPALAVTALTPTVDGFTVQFNHAFNPALLNLYATQPANQGRADVTLLSSSHGAISGSLVLSPDSMSITFLATRGALPADSYTVDLRSATDAFADSQGALDGATDGGASDYTASFSIA